jgi:carbon storage regulator CsrA
MTMLVLSRKPGEQVRIGEVTLTVVRVKGNTVTLAFRAPDAVRILRGELDRPRASSRREGPPEVRPDLVVTR